MKKTQGIMREAKNVVFKPQYTQCFTATISLPQTYEYNFQSQTYLQCQIFQTTKLQIAQMYRMHYPVTHPAIWILDRQNCNE
jgi:hypothetical protein